MIHDTVPNHLRTARPPPFVPAICLIRSGLGAARGSPTAATGEIPSPRKVDVTGSGGVSVFCPTRFGAVLSSTPSWRDQIATARRSPGLVQTDKGIRP